MSHAFPILLGVAFVALVVAIVVNVRLGGVRRSEVAFGRGLGRGDLPHGQKGASIPGADAPDVPVESDMRDRVKILAGVIAGAFGVLFLRLWGMQVVSSASYTARAQQNLTREVSTRAARGRILDRNGSVLVDNRPSMTLVADKSVADDTRLVKRLSNLLGMPEVAVRRNIQSTTEGAQSQRTVALDVPDAAVAYVAGHPSQFPGVSIESRTVRSYPFGRLACHLLGYAGTISSEELAAYAADEGNLISYQSGDVVGKSGVEYQYESVLQGVRGTRTVHVNADGDVTGVVSEVDPKPGCDVRLSIDVSIQQAAERSIQTGYDVAHYLGYTPTGGAVVCIDCKTGEVLAMASYPDYSPASFIGGISTEDWAQLVSAEANSPLLNRAIDGLYPSASTMKPLTTCAALENGLATQWDYFECEGYWTGLGEQYGMSCWNHAGHGWLNLHDGITNSCDVVFYEIAKKFYYSDNPEGMQQMFRRWGLGAKTGIDLPGEAEGRIPDSAWKWSWYSSAADYDRAWQPGDSANIAIGQGDVLVTPLQMCYAYCGLVNGAVQMWPHVMLDVLSNDTYEPVAYCNEHVQKTVAIDPDILAFVDRAMWGVLNETVVGDYLGGLPVEVMGKSGTGEAGDDDFNTHAWFIAAAPASDPTYVVAALLEHGGGGGDVTTHMCREVLGEIYGVEMTDPIALLRGNNVSTAAVMD